MLRSLSISAIGLLILCCPVTAAGLPLGTYSIESNDGYGKYIDLQAPQTIKVIPFGSYPPSTYWDITNDAANHLTISIPNIGNVDYLKSVTTYKQTYPGELIYNVWKPLGLEEAPTFGRVVGIKDQPSDIYLDGQYVVNLDKHVPSDVISNKWRLETTGYNAELVRSAIKSFGISDDKISQLVFANAGDSGTHIFDIDVDTMSETQKVMVANISPDVARGYSPNWSRGTYHAQLSFKRNLSSGTGPADASASDGQMFAQEIKAQLATIGISEQFEPDGDGETFRSDMLYHLSYVKEESRNGVGYGNPQLWIYDFLRVVFFKSDDTYRAVFNFSDLKCRENSADRRPLDESAMADDCEKLGVTPSNVGDMILAPIMVGLAATKTLSK